MPAFRSLGLLVILALLPGVVPHSHARTCDAEQFLAGDDPSPVCPACRPAAHPIALDGHQDGSPRPASGSYLELPAEAATLRELDTRLHGCRAPPCCV